MSTNVSFFRDISAAPKTRILTAIVSALMLPTNAESATLKIMANSATSSFFSNVTIQLDQAASKEFDPGKDFPTPPGSPSPKINHYQTTSSVSNLSRSVSNIPYFPGTVSYEGFTPVISAFIASDLPSDKTWLFVGYSGNTLVTMFPLENNTAYGITGLDKYLVVAKPALIITKSLTNQAAAFDLSIKFPDQISGLQNVALEYSPNLSAGSWSYIGDLNSGTNGLYTKLNQQKIGDSGFFRVGFLK